MRKAKKTRYVVAFIITIILFSLGLMIGFMFENLRLSKMYEELRVKKVEFSDLELTNRYISHLEEQGSCDKLYGIFFNSMMSLDDKRLKLEEYYEKAQLKSDDYTLLKHEYLLSSLDYWLLANKIKAKCGARFGIILYFYGSNIQCPRCDDQGTHLTYIKKSLKDDVLIFSLDGNTPGIIQMLKETYNVTNYPAVIINDEKHNYINNEDILAKLCESANYEQCSQITN